MSLFGGKKEDREVEKKEEEVAEVSAPTAQEVPVPNAEDIPSETPEQKREKESKKLLVTLYVDTGQLKVEAVQNINSRAEAEFLVNRAEREYERSNIANLTAMILMQTLAKTDKGKKIWVPGTK
jgi:hypothetical protein